MPTLFHGRQAVSIENEALRVTVLKEGGHVAEVLHKKSGISPLWVPHWPSIEPSQFDPVTHPEFGGGADGRLLAGIMGHNLCLDIFGGPSEAEAAAGLTAHGEASVAEYAIDTRPGELVMEARLPMAALDVRRTLELHGDVVHIQERVRNLTACDRPIGWTQHVTLAPPFLRHGETEFHTSATRSKVFESQFGPADYLSAGAIFDWPDAPAIDGSTADLRVLLEAVLIERLHRAPQRSVPPERVLCRIHPDVRAGVRLPVEGVRLPVVGHLGRKPKPRAVTMESAVRHTRNGIRRVAVSGDTAPDDRSRFDVRSPDLPMDSRSRNYRGRLPGCRP